MPVNTTYDPTKVADFEKTKIHTNAQGISATISTATSTNLDIPLTEDHLLTGAWVITDNANLGDYVQFQILDTSGTFTGVAGTVLNQFITNWYMSKNTDVQLDMSYPAKLLAGMTLRVVYNSVGSNSNFVAINYKLHKVMI